MLRYMTDRTRPGLVAFYNIRPGNRAGQFLQPRSPHGAVVYIKHKHKPNAYINSNVPSLTQVTPLYTKPRTAISCYCPTKRPRRMPTASTYHHNVQYMLHVIHALLIIKLLSLRHLSFCLQTSVWTARWKSTDMNQDLCHMEYDTTSPTAQSSFL